MGNEQLNMVVSQRDVAIDLAHHGIISLNQDCVFPYIILTLCLEGSVRALYNMQEITQRKNDLAFLMPGHIIHPLDCSEDYTFARIAVSMDLFQEMQMHTYSHNYDKFNYTPLCHLTEPQAERLLSIMKLMAVIASHDPKELKQRRQMLISQLAVGYEFLNYYRTEQDRQWSENKHMTIFSRFCDLVVVHYKESRELQFYAEKLHLTPKHFAKIIREVAGISPTEWIGHYVVTQAKRLVETHPGYTLEQVAYELGFCEPSAFHHYFKRVTGMTARQYMRRDRQSTQTT